MKTGDKGLTLIRVFESFRDKAYLDSAGIWTIGYGTIRINGAPVTRGMTCTHTQAVRWMQTDLAEFEEKVTKLLKVPVDQHEFDALVSFTYNVGHGALAKSTLLRKINAGEPILERYFTAWNKARDPKTKQLVPLAGLTRRRKAEFHLFCVNEVKTTFE